MRTALITGVTGQDGAYLADFLLSKGYAVYGTYRRTSLPNFVRLRMLGIYDKISLIPFDLLDQSSIIEAIKETKPAEIYNLAAQSFVEASFEQPIATGEVSGLGLTRLLDTVRIMCPDAKFYQASTSEMYGNTDESPQSESTPFAPCSPYAAAKLYAHWITKSYRDAYGLFACSGILFNHESPLRGLEFVTRKITHAVARIKNGLQDKLHLGNMAAKRDWGYAKDYVECMWLMMQQDEPDDYVVATGKSHSVQEFAELAFSCAGLNWEDYVESDKSLYRPKDIRMLLGDPAKAIRKLGWNPEHTPFQELVRVMVSADLEMVSSATAHPNLTNIS